VVAPSATDPSQHQTPPATLASAVKHARGSYQNSNNQLKKNKNSSGDEIANVNFYAVRPEATQIR